MTGSASRANHYTADAIVVGAGPAGSSAATHLARAGLEVIVLEKSAFPRDKVCGDALTPRAVHELQLLGYDTSAAGLPGWHRNRGLRLIGGGHRLEIDWPQVSGMPDFGLTNPRMRLDEDLARHARAQGARIFEQVMATDPIIGADGWVEGVHATGTDHRGRKVGPEAVFRAPVVIAADGVSSRMAVRLGLTKRDDRPMGVAVRTYYETPRHADPYIESWLELRPRDEKTGRLGDAMPGYGWLFPLGDGTVNVGLGMLDTSPMFGKTDYKAVLRDWIDAMGDEWGIAPGRELDTVRSAALPMAFNRTPHHHRGVLLVGDSGGMVNPFNGEGIDYALEAGRLAAEVVATHHRYPRAARRATYDRYPELVRSSMGSYFTLGRAFAQVIGRPELMELGVKYGMGSTTLMTFVVKLLANLYQDRTAGDRDVYDRLISALNTLVPATDNTGHHA
ncbi:geranylgeranyl reductase family protein [Brevibacterium litoralis]|uniref:geranylgeranyl reductase family protein n=1 Tax=Brevibacterium litoralis TaxID=3138935 RepID=UPI0032EF32D1